MENKNPVNLEETTQTEVSTEATSTTDALTSGVMQERDIKQVSKKQAVTKVLVQIGLYTFLGIMALIVLFPFYWMIISSLKTTTEYNDPLPTLFPKKIWPYNYSDALTLSLSKGTSVTLINLFGNTLFVGVISTLLSLVITVLSAFAFARLEFKGKNLLFAGLLATMMIPGELFTITNFETVVRDFKWGETFTALIVPFLVSIFYIYLLKQNFQQIPNELYLAAKVDGTTDFKYLLRVMIPLALPTIISITLLKMMGAWNTYMWPNLVADVPELYLITNGLRKMSIIDPVTQEQNIPIQMAAVTIVSTPLFLVFIFLRKYIMKGVSRSGIKG